MDEIWKEIPDYEGIYEVSSLGRIRSKGNLFSRKEKILKGYQHGKYKKIALFKNGIRKKLFVHRVVMLAFVGQSDLEVDHIDSNPSNNNLSNLRYLPKHDNLKRRTFKSIDTQYIHINCPCCNNEVKIQIKIPTC